MTAELLGARVFCRMFAYRMVARKRMEWDAYPYPLLTPLIASGQLFLSRQKP